MWPAPYSAPHTQLGRCLQDSSLPPPPSQGQAGPKGEGDGHRGPPAPGRMRAEPLSLVLVSEGLSPNLEDIRDIDGFRPGF